MFPFRTVRSSGCWNNAPVNVDQWWILTKSMDSSQYRPRGFFTLLALRYWTDRFSAYLSDIAFMETDSDPVIFLSPIFIISPPFCFVFFFMNAPTQSIIFI